ncbi:hypothetical protein VTG60DRAFT_5810 [Thermothelomyces hinnuleus]
MTPLSQHTEFDLQATNSATRHIPPLCLETNTGERALMIRSLGTFQSAALSNMDPFQLFNGSRQQTWKLVVHNFRALIEARRGEFQAGLAACLGGAVRTRWLPKGARWRCTDHLQLFQLRSHATNLVPALPIRLVTVGICIQHVVALHSPPQTKAPETRHCRARDLSPGLGVGDAHACSRGRQSLPPTSSLASGFGACPD